MVLQVPDAGRVMDIREYFDRDEILHTTFDLQGNQHAKDDQKTTSRQTDGDARFTSHFRSLSGNASCESIV